MRRRKRPIESPVERTGPISSHRQRRQNHEENDPPNRKSKRKDNSLTFNVKRVDSFVFTLNDCSFSDRQRRQRMRAGMRFRIHQLHNQRSQRKVPPGETQDHQRGGHPVRHVHAGLRQLRRTPENLPPEVSGIHQR